MRFVLITGGCGFIGSNFIKRFLRTHKGWKVLNLDKLSYCGNRENTRELEGLDHYEFLQGDICDAAMVDTIMGEMEAVIHFAAETHVDRSIDNADDFIKTNIMGTRVLLEAARKYHVERFVHISSDEVYGSISSGVVGENAPLRPGNPYSATKAAADLMVEAYQNTYDLPVMIVRSSNNFGPFQFPEKIIPLFVTNVLEGKKVPLYATGENRRDWIYVEDNCRAIELVFDKGKIGEIYNAPGKNEISNRELTLKILKLLGCSEEMIENVTDRPGHDFRYAMDGAKIKKLGFVPDWTWDRALEATIRWYQESRNWWQPLKRDKFTLR